MRQSFSRVSLQVRESDKIVVNNKDSRLLRGRVEGVSIQFLCDTGADSTVVSSKYFSKFPRIVKAMFQDSASRVGMPDGRNVVSKGPVLCDIEVNGRTVREVVYVADIGDQALLGWDAQLALGVKYSIGDVM
jgi:hypothetical protein